jgi:hypothetical protein
MKTKVIRDYFGKNKFLIIDKKWKYVGFIYNCTMSYALIFNITKALWEAME